MNSTIVGICLNGITVSTEEYTIGHFSPNGIQQRHRTVPCLYNRIELNHWTNPDSIIDAISYPWQYEAYNNSRYKAAIEYYSTGSISNADFNKPLEISSMNSCLEAVIPIYFGREKDFTNGVMYFHSFENPSDWPYHDDYEQVFIPGTEGFWWYR